MNTRNDEGNVLNGKAACDNIVLVTQIEQITPRSSACVSLVEHCHSNIYSRPLATYSRLLQPHSHSVRKSHL